MPNAFTIPLLINNKNVVGPDDQIIEDTFLHFPVALIFFCVITSAGRGLATSDHIVHHTSFAHLPGQ